MPAITRGGPNRHGPVRWPASAALHSPRRRTTLRAPPLPWLTRTRAVHDQASAPVLAGRPIVAAPVSHFEIAARIGHHAGHVSLQGASRAAAAARGLRGGSCQRHARAAQCQRQGRSGRATRPQAHPAAAQACLAVESHAALELALLHRGGGGRPPLPRVRPCWQPVCGRCGAGGHTATPCCSWRRPPPLLLLAAARTPVGAPRPSLRARPRWRSRPRQTRGSPACRSARG